MGVKDRYNEKQKTSNNKTEITTKSGTSTPLGVKQRYEQKKSSSNNTGSVSQIDLDNHKKYLEQQAAYEKRLSYDLDAGAKEIAYLESIQDEVTKLNVMTQHSNMVPADAKARIQSRYDELDAQLGEYGGLDALKSVISEKKQEYSLAERAQRAKELTSVMDEKSESYDVDFNKYATLGADYGKDPEKWWQSAENYVAYLRNNPEQLKAYDEVAAKNANAIVKNVSMDQLSYKAAKYMKDEEYSLYNYYFAKDKENGTKLADEYLRSIEDVLNSRQATGIVEDYSNKSDLAKIFYAGEVGLDQFISGMEGWAADGYTAPSAIQQAGGAIREDLEYTGRTLPEWLGGASLGQAAYDVVSTTSNMLPSILASTVVNAVAPGAGTVVGATLMGASAGGNARAEMLNLGYSKEQATTYGILIGAAEAGMEYVLGNIPGLSKGDGIFSTLGTKVATKVDNAIARVAIKLGENGTKVLKAVAGGAIKMTGGALDEALEEGLQTVIEPWLKEIATSVDWDDPKIDEILYSSLLGALSSFALGGAQTTIESSISNGVSNANAEYVYGDGKDLVSEAIELDPSNAFAQKMQAKVNEGKSLSGRQINRLVQQNETAKLAFSETEGADFDVKVAADTNVGGKSAPVAEISTKADRSNVNTAEENGAKTGEKLASVTATNSKGETVKGEIRKVEANGDKVSFVLANGEKVAREDASFASDDMQLVADIATEHISLLDGFTPEAATAMIKGYDGSTDAAQYVAAFDAAYKLGADGAPSSALVRLMNDGVSERVAYTAYVIGKDSVKNAQNALKNGENNGIINNTNENSEAEYESGESVRLRNGGKRSGGQNTDGQVSRMESGTGQAESEAESRRIADSEAARLLNEGREVTVASLGILGGSHEQTVRLVDPASETASMKEARKQAEARGLKVKFFVGDNLLIKGKDGKWISARAYIKGGFVFVRGDHAKYTADQLMRHELGHDMIAKGEVDIDAVRERLVDLVGKENLDEVAKLYADAYAGTGMTADEIWEECICDSLGDMNIFADVNDLGEFMEGILPEIQKAASQNKAPTQTRGSPDGKASRETNQYTEKEYRDFGWARANDVITASESEDLRSKFAAIVSGQVIARKTKSGEYMIAIGEDVNNKIAYMTGTIDNPVITRVLEIYEYNETKLDEKRRETYALEGRGIQRKAGGIFHVNTSASFGGAEHQQRKSKQSERHNDQLNSQRSRSEIKTNPITRAKVNEEENTVTYTYRNGETVTYSSPEEAKVSGKVNDAKFSIEFADNIANNQRKFVADGLSRISGEELEKAIADTAHMVNEMKPYANILPQDKVGKTLVKNGSYDVSVENTTVCIRTLAYNSFVDMVSEKIGRPLTQMESFLVSQKLYDIAKEPQCLYCYVSLDRKAFNEMVIRYTEQRDAAIEAYEAAGKPKIPSAFDAEWPLFKEFLDGRKTTTNMWDRYVGWISAYNKGDRLVSLADISTEAKRLELVEGGGEIASQVKDILKYAQSASWAKKQTQYVAYYDEILKLKPAVIRNLNNHYGMRWYSFSDYSGAFIVENMQQITDAAIRGLKGLSYTKDTDFAEIFAPTGMNINISVYAKKTADGGYEIDAKQSANIDEAIKLREQYPNVGIVVVATDAAGVEWALAQEWSDVVIPFHTVRTGADVAEFYNWEIFNAEQSDTVSDQNLWDAYVSSVGKKKASKMVYPSEHQNNKDTYLSILAQRGLTPRFKSFLENPNYMKLVNETRQSEGHTSPLKAEFNLDAAERSFDKFVEKGGYYEGWYNDGIDVDGEADIVAEDVRAGKRANEVSYGRQDVNFDDVAKSRKVNREHGKASQELDFVDFAERLSTREVLANALESVAQDDLERTNLKKYKDNIAHYDAEEAKLKQLRAEIKELSFATGERDTAKIRQLRDEALKTENRINIYDKRLLSLEASAPIKKVLDREKKKAYERAYSKAYDKAYEKGYVDGKFACIEGQIGQQAVYNATNTAVINCLQNQVNTLMGLTKTVIPNTSICPGWGNVTVAPATTTTG